MKSAVVALDSTSLKGKTFDRVCDTIRLFQTNGLFSQLSIASVFHASLTPLPLEFYAENKNRLIKEALNSIKLACHGQFVFDSIRILQSSSPTNEDNVKLLSRFCQKVEADLLILGGNDRAGLPYWFLGSFSETASFTAAVPVLTIKSHVKPSDFSTRPNFVVAVDVATPPSEKMIQWVAASAKVIGARIELVYVTPKERMIFDSLQKRRNKKEANAILQSVQKSIHSQGIHSKATVLDESTSIAHDIAKFAEDKHAWLTIVTAAKRSRARRIFLGSRARRILALSKYPILSLRLD